MAVRCCFWFLVVLCLSLFTSHGMSARSGRGQFHPSPTIRRQFHVPSYPARLKHLPKRPRHTEAWERSPARSDRSAYSADIARSRARTRSGHRSAANQQLHEAMKRNPSLRRRVTKQFGHDAFERTSAHKGRRNPRGGEWDHSTRTASRLDLRTKKHHADITKRQRKRREPGGYQKFHKRRERGRDSGPTSCSSYSRLHDHRDG
jgi:hypothetical protein